MEFTMIGYTIHYVGFRVCLGLYWDNGKENGSYYLGFRVYLAVLHCYQT